MSTTDGWLAYWSGDISLYVSPRHLAAHYDRLYAELQPHLPTMPFALVDYGCGEALMAPRLAADGARVHLVDEAPGRAGQLAARFAGVDGVAVADRLEDVAGRCDVAIMISVSQYIPKDVFPDLARRLAATLKPDGKLVIGDILPPDNSMVADVTALFRFAWANNFFPAAVAGLLRTVRSPYRAARQRLGLSTWTPDEMIAALEEAGLDARPIERNIGHAGHRHSVIATR